MKFKDWAKLYFIACGALSMLIVCVELIFYRFEEHLAPSLMECYILVLIILCFVAFIESMKYNRKFSNIITTVFMFVLLVVERVILNIVRNKDVDILSALLLAAFGTVVGLTARLVIWLFCKVRNTRMNQKLKEYQDNNQD